MTYTDFHEEKHVRITKVPEKYKRLLADLDEVTGIIKEVTKGADGVVSVGVYIPNQHNPASSKNLFWFTKKDITLINKEGEQITMNISHYSNKNYKFCYTTKLNSGVTELHAYQGDLKEGDYVICNNNYSNGALSVRIVIKANVPREELETYDVDGEIMGVADVSAYFTRKENEKKAAELKKKMMERAKAYQEEAFWKMMAKEDQQMAELLAEYEEVNK